MHLSRAQTSRTLPVARKGTTYVARPFSHVNTSVSALGAVRDMLHLGRTAREVNELVKSKKLKINGRVVRDYHEPIHLFSIFEADKSYVLTLLPTGRFSLIETDSKKRIAKVVNKTMVGGGKMQINLHDGTNFVSQEKLKVGDSVELDLSGKVIKVLHLEKGKEVFIESGRNKGWTGKIVSAHGKNVSVKLKEGEVVLKQDCLIVI